MTASKGGARVLRNEDVAEIVAEIPEGHCHLRTTVMLADGSSLTLQEAAVAAIVRAYVAVKTDPLRNRVVLRGRKVSGRKDGYAEWQLMEEQGSITPPEMREQTAEEMPATDDRSRV